MTNAPPGRRTRGISQIRNIETKRFTMLDENQRPALSEMFDNASVILRLPSRCFVALLCNTAQVHYQRIPAAMADNQRTLAPSESCQETTRDVTTAPNIGAIMRDIIKRDEMLARLRQEREAHHHRDIWTKGPHDGTYQKVLWY